jgi:hypothetical protein
MSYRVGYVMRGRRLCYNDADGGLTEAVDEIDDEYNYLYKTSDSRELDITHGAFEGKNIRFFYTFRYKPDFPMAHYGCVPINSLFGKYLKQRYCLLPSREWQSICAANRQALRSRRSGCFR